MEDLEKKQRRKDILNMIVIGVCSFICGLAFHSSLAHYLPDTWDLIDEILKLLGL